MNNKLIYVALSLGALALLLNAYGLVGGNNLPAQIIENEKGILGGITRFPNSSLSALFFAGTSETATSSVQGPVEFDGLTVFVSNASCADATTTIFAVINPFKATSTVDYVSVYGKNGTSTAIDLLIGTSSVSSLHPSKGTSTIPVVITPSLIAAAQIGTSTGFYFSSASLFGMPYASSSPASAYNSTFWVSLASAAGVGGVDNTATTSQVGELIAAQNRIVVGPTDYVVGLATTSFVTPNDATSLVGNSGIVSAVNEFSCTYNIRWLR